LNKIAKISLKVLLWIVIGIIGLVLLAYFLIQVPSIQNYTVQKVVHYLEGKIGTPVRLNRISLDLPKRLVLEGIYFEDEQRDTLVAGDTLKVDISLLKLLANKVEINELDFRGITATINRTLPDSAFNFDYIIRAFTTEEVNETSTDTTAAMAFSIDKINLDRIRIRYADDVVGTSAALYLGHLDTRIKVFDLEKMFFEIPKLNINGFSTQIKQWAVAEADEIPSTSALGVEAAAGEEAPLPDIRIGTLELANIDIGYEDQVTALNAALAFKTLQVSFDELNIPQEKVDINKVLLEGTSASIAFGKPAEASKADTTTADSTPVEWVVTAKSIQLNDNHIRYDDNNFPTIKKGMDYSHLNLKNLTLDLEKFYFSMDSIRGDLNNLYVKDTSGLEVKKLASQFVYTERGATLQDLYLETPHTLIRDYIKVEYPGLDKIAEHPEYISLDANIKNSKLGMTDVRLLVPELDTMEVMKPLLTRTFHINGKVKGRVDNISIPNLEFSTLDNTRLSASGTIQGLPDVDKMKVDLNIRQLKTGRADLDRLVAKSLLPDSIQLPESLALHGKISGGMSGFNTDLHLNSSIGTADVNGKFLLGQDTTYNADIRIADFDLGSLMGNDTTYGKITVSAAVNGKGLDPAKAVADLEADLHSLVYNGYTYSGINFKANANQGDIVANLSSTDPNIKMDLDANAAMDGKYPSVELRLNIDSINLKNLNLSDDDIRYHGQLEANLPTADPDFLNGDIHILHSLVYYNGDRFALDSISLHSEAEDSLKFMSLSSEFLSAQLIGDYKLTELSTAVQDVIGAYYQPEPKTDTATYSPQSFEFSAAFIRSPFIEGFVPSLTEMQPVTLDGNFMSENKSINIRLGAKHILYDGMLVDTVSLDLNTADSTMYYAGNIGKIAISNIQFINTLLSGTIKDSKIDIGLWVKDSTAKEQYHIGADLFAQNKDFIFKLQPDGLMLNYEAWNVDPQNELRFGEQGILAHNFILENQGQSLSLLSQDSTLNAPIQATFDDFRIETFTKYIESNTLKIGGGINGNALIDRLESSPVFVTDLTIDDFYFGNDTLGNINMKIDNKLENTYTANITINGEGNDVNLSGDFVNPPEGNSSLDFILDLRNLNMTTLEAFSFGNIRNTSGSLSGELSIRGNTAAPRINGDLLFNKAALNVSMLNARFLIDQQKINFSDEGLNFRKFTIADSIGNKASITGKVRTKTYTDYAFDLNVDANNFQVVNSTAKDNDLFYGKLFINTDLTISGNMDNPVVNGTIGVNEKTVLSIVVPDDNPGLVETEGIVEFVDMSDTSNFNLYALQDTLLTNTLTGMDVSLNIDIDPDAAFNIIIDPGSGDALYAKGKAQLTAGIDPSGAVTMAGTYEVSEGNYQLSFNMLKRKFDFKKGSTITWSGDPLDADLDITAAYLIEAPPIDLVENQLSGQNSNYYKEKIPFTVDLFIKGKMMKPELSFGISLEDNSSVSQDVSSLVETRLAQIEEDESELNKQVFALIVLGRFVAENPFSSSAGGSIGTMARESVSKLLSAQLNKLAGDLIAGVDLNFDLESTDDYSTGRQETRTDLNVGLSKNLLNDRLKVTVGSNFELEGANQPGRQPTNIAGDISLEYQLSRDGRYLLRAYRKNEYEVTLQGQVIETGLGFVVNMSYDDFKELFMNSKKLQRYQKRKAAITARKYIEREERPERRRRRRSDQKTEERSENEK